MLCSSKKGEGTFMTPTRPSPTKFRSRVRIRPHASSLVNHIGRQTPLYMVYKGGVKVDIGYGSLLSMSEWAEHAIKATAILVVFILNTFLFIIYFLYTCISTDTFNHTSARNECKRKTMVKAATWGRHLAVSN